MGMPERCTGKAVYFIVHICFTVLSSLPPYFLWCCCYIEGFLLAYKTVWDGYLISCCVSLLVFLSLVALKRLITTMLEYMLAYSGQSLRLMRPLKLKVRAFEVTPAVLYKCLGSSPILMFFLLAPPHVVAYKHSESANEKDKAVLTCVSHGYPLPTDWTWHKLSDEGQVGKT